MAPYITCFLVAHLMLGSGEACHEYGLGWSVKAREKSYAFCKDQSFYASHTGGAIGASSVLLIGRVGFFFEKKNFP